MNELSNKCRDSEILAYNCAYNCIVRKVHDDFKDGIKSFAIKIGIIIIVMLVTWFISVWGPARDFFITIIQENDLHTQIRTYTNIAQTYGIVLTLIAAFTLYKVGKVSEKIEKTVDDYLKFHKGHSRQAFKERERGIINEYERKKTNLTTEDKDHLDLYVEWLKTYAKQREKIKLQLKWFVYFHSIPLISYILLLFLHKTEFLQKINALILIVALFFLFSSFYLTYHLVKTLKE